MPALKTRPTLAVLVSDREMAKRVPKLRNIRKFTKPSEALLQGFNKIFVSVSLQDLSSVSDFVKEANDKNHLRSLLIHDIDSSNLLPQFLHRANLRTLRNMIVHSDLDVLPRILNAYSIGAESELIADARLADQRLIVISCAGDVYDISLAQIKGFGGADEELRTFEVEEDGSYLYWPKLDLHLDIQAFREMTDASERKKAELERLQSDRVFGKAVAALRKRQQLRQSDIEGLSDRQVRRIENGTQTKVSTLKLLARAHDMSFNNYLNALAELMRTIQ